MPNFFTKTSQKIGEAFSGPRTKDNEFDLKVEDMKIVERGVLGFKTFLANFSIYTQTLKNFANEMNATIKNLYEKNSSYAILAGEMYEAHLQMDKIYDTFLNRVTNIAAGTKDWQLFFNDAKTQINKREQLRKTYDHYDEKLEKLYKSKQERIKKNQMDTQKEMDLLKRVKMLKIE
jgi:hypothetical protein